MIVTPLAQCRCLFCYSVGDVMKADGGDMTYAKVNKMNAPANTTRPK